MLLPIPRGGATGYETWTPLLKEKIASSLNFIDVFENRRIKKDHFIIDHKFPEIRWDDETRRNDINNLTEEEILRDFQLIDNQRNQQKREVCRSCFQTSQRGSLYGLEFFYSGDKTWDASIPTSGKAAEAGCIGCGWYDIAAWRIALQEVINKEASKEV